MNRIHAGTSDVSPYKYSRGLSAQADKIIPTSLSESARGLIAASLSHSSWCKNASARNSFKNFELETSTQYTWPLSENAIIRFTDWCLNKKKLRFSTVNSYLGSLEFAHKLNGLDGKNCKHFLAKKMIRGAENMEFYSTIAKQSRKVMTLPLLKILSHQIANSNWEDLSKQVFWTAASLAFFGSFRMGELLSGKDSISHPSENLLWEDVHIRNDSVVIKIKIPKNRNSKGQFVDLFEFKDSRYCPVLAVKKLKLMLGRKDVSKMPVFSFSSGILLTPMAFNKSLVALLQPVIGEAASSISGHSFRAAIPSALASCPELASDEEVMIWGRWSSPCFKSYMRLSPLQKKRIFEKIVSSLYIV